jgi:hypothetical protein
VGNEEATLEALHRAAVLGSDPLIIHDLVLSLGAAADTTGSRARGELMTFTRDTNAKARRAAGAAVAYLGEEERWALLQKWLLNEPAGQRNAGRRSLKLEALRGIVCPRVKDREWDKVLREHAPARWVQELRLANAFAGRQPPGSA